MAVTKKWDGIGATNGPMTVSSAGSGDNVFSVVSTGLTVTSGSIVVPAVTNTATTYVRWNDLSLSAWSTRCYIQFDGDANGIAHVIYAWSTTNVRMWSVSINTSRQIQFRNAAGSAIGTALAISLGIKYRFEVRGQSGTDSITFKVFNASEVEIYTLTSAIGTTLGLFHVQYGRQQSSVQFGPASYSNLQINNTNATIGAYVPPAQGPTPWVVLNSNGTTTPLTLNGMWNGSSILPVDLGQIYTPSVMTRKAFDWPWAADAFQNTSVGSGAIFEGLTTGQTANLHSVGSRGIGIGVNQSRWSTEMYQAKLSDPDVTLIGYKSYIGNPDNPTYYTIKCPTTAQPAGGSDMPVGVVQPDGFTMYEIYKFTWADSGHTTIHSSYVNINDIRLYGLARGSRGSGISMIDGLIRYKEMLALYIPHTLLLSLPAALLHTGPLWPARVDDNQSLRPWANESNGIHYGTQFAIPGSVNLAALNLSPMGLAVGKALQDYGCHVLIQAETASLFVEPYAQPAETDMPGLQTELKPDWQTKLFPRLQRLTNNNPGTLGAERVPLDPSGIAGGGTRRVTTPIPQLSDIVIDEVACWGDSLTLSTGNNWPGQLATALGIPVSNQGVGGMGTSDIALRQGGLVPLVTVSGNSIPASTAEVAVTAISPATGWRINGTGDFSRVGTLAGVPGTLRHDLETNAFWFRRTTAVGSPTAIAAASPFVGNPLITNIPSKISVFWTGRNNSFNPAPERVTANTQLMVNFLDSTPKRYLVLSVTNTGSEGIGTTFYPTIISINNALAAAHPNNYFDLRSYLISSGLAAAGITPTSGDNTDIANDVIPRSLRSDSTHLNSAGYVLVADRVEAFIRSKGWV